VRLQEPLVSLLLRFNAITVTINIEKPHMQALILAEQSTDSPHALVQVVELMGQDMVVYRYDNGVGQVKSKVGTLHPALLVLGSARLAVSCPGKDRSKASEPSAHT